MKIDDLKRLNEQYPTTLKDWFNGNLSDSAEDIAKHGCVGGFPGITYYSETVEKYNDYHEEIWERLYEDGLAHGQNILELIASFNGSKNVESDDQFKNLLVWYYIEQLANDKVNNGVNYE